jgi:hypothetical protein
LTSDELVDVADRWRDRARCGDGGAELVAQALELLARRRQSERERTRVQAVAHRLSEMMRI